MRLSYYMYADLNLFQVFVVMSKIKYLWREKKVLALSL